MVVEGLSAKLFFFYLVRNTMLRSTFSPKPLLVIFSGVAAVYITSNFHVFMMIISHIVVCACVPVHRSTSGNPSHRLDGHGVLQVCSPSVFQYFHRSSWGCLLVILRLREPYVSLPTQMSITWQSNPVSLSVLQQGTCMLGSSILGYGVLYYLVPSPQIVY